MNKKFVLMPLVFLLFIGLLNGCGLSTPTSGLRGGACYWINQQRVDLPTSPTQTQSASIPISNVPVNSKGLEGFNGKVYVAGGNDIGSFYWVNGVTYYLDGNSANDIFVDGEDVYVAGDFLNKDRDLQACYWKNGTRVDLGAHNYVHSIFVKDSTIYMAGSYWVIPDTYEVGDIIFGNACYWINNQRIPIDGGGLTGIFVEGNDIYLSGTFHDSKDDVHGCFWKNNNRYELDNNYTSAIIVKNSKVYTSGFGQNNNAARSIFVDGEDVYTAGYYEKEISPRTFHTFPCLWKNKEIIPLETTVYPDGGEIKDIFVSGPDVFMIGSWYNNNGGEFSGLWYNGEMIWISGSHNAVFVTRP